MADEKQPADDYPLLSSIVRQRGLEMKAIWRHDDLVVRGFCSHHPGLGGRPRKRVPPSRSSWRTGTPLWRPSSLLKNSRSL